MITTAMELLDATLKLGKRNLNKKSMRHVMMRLPRVIPLLLALASIPIILIKSVESVDPVNHDDDDDWVNMDHFLSVLFHDLTNEGLFKPTPPHTAVLMTNSNHHRVGHHMQLLPLNDLERQAAVHHKALDFVFTTDFAAASEFIERTLKIGGVVAVLVDDDRSAAALYKLPKYKITYARKLDSYFVVAMKRSPEAEPRRRKLCGYTAEAKRAALSNLEDVLLEPPRASSGKSRKYLKRTRYLPDLMGDSLESYPRRVFIDVGLAEEEGGSGTDWFANKYPTRNKKFDMYKIETVSGGNNGEVPQLGMAEWLRKNVRDEEYVVMKAEAEVVEEMMKADSITLVDELFLECKPHGKNGSSRSPRAYWECLALYGKLRDEGVAVHQWWG